MRIAVLGCAGGIGAGLRTTAFLVDGDVLVDAGTGVGDLGYDDMRGIRHVFLTHSHLDHSVGIPLLADSVFEERDEPLVVHARQATIDALRTHIFNWQIWPDFAQLPSVSEPVVRFEPIEPGEVHYVDARSFEAIEVAHTVPAVGFLCLDAGTGVCFSGDTSTNDTLWPALNRANRLDLLIVEVGCPNDEEELAHLSGHYSPRLLAADLGKLDRRPRIAVTHLHPRYEELTMAQLVEALPDYDICRLQPQDSFAL